MMSFWHNLLRRHQPDQPALVIGTTDGINHTHRLLGSRRRSLVGAVTIGPKGQRRSRVRLLGTRTDLARVIGEHGVQLAYLCIPIAMHELAEDLSQQLAQLSVDVRRLPTPQDQIEGRTGLWAGPASADTLLDRVPHPLDEAGIEQTLRGKRILITGAGGSIGSELVRIAARYQPASLILMDRSENSLFEIDRQLAETSDVPRLALLHDVTDAPRTAELLNLHRPQVVFHAAAHKHVPMMEDHPHQAVTNNYFGTRSVADAAEAAGCERFVMISSDKAVHPSSVMGATKRMAEWYIQHLAERSETQFSMVRFGNVLGSACSVIPIWSRQLAAGGPITVTDRRMTRFFMTITEAASLVIQSAALGDNQTPLFVLDMGEPVRIVDLAERFITMHGLTVGRDVDIVFTGARPGEKLHEQLAYAHEDMLETAHASVRRLHTSAPDPTHVAWMNETFSQLIRSGGRDQILSALRKAVPEMGHTPSHESLRPIRRTA
jgi:FlaA1/EpsC-like NDP-sugar epimerase